MTFKQFVYKEENPVSSYFRQCAVHAGATHVLATGGRYNRGSCARSLPTDYAAGGSAHRGQRTGDR